MAKTSSKGGYKEPSGYFPKELRKKYGLGEYADKPTKTAGTKKKTTAKKTTKKGK